MSRHIVGEPNRILEVAIYFCDLLTTNLYMSMCPLDGRMEDL